MPSPTEIQMNLLVTKVNQIMEAVGKVAMRLKTLEASMAVLKPVTDAIERTNSH